MQWTQFPNFYAKSNPSRVDLSIKLANQSIFFLGVRWFSNISIIF